MIYYWFGDCGLGYGDGCGKVGKWWGFAGGIGYGKVEKIC